MRIYRRRYSKSSAKLYTLWKLYTAKIFFSHLFNLKERENETPQAEVAVQQPLADGKAIHEIYENQRDEKNEAAYLLV